MSMALQYKEPSSNEQAAFPGGQGLLQGSGWITSHPLRFLSLLSSVQAAQLKKST